MALSQLVYVSRRTPDLTPEALAEVVAASGSRNLARGITGTLLCCGLDLMQLLEGEMTDVVGLYETIRRDARHEGVRMLFCKNVAKRMFPEWGMGLSDLSCRQTLDIARLVKLVEDVRATSDTGPFSVEARVLLGDFRQQLKRAA